MKKPRPYREGDFVRVVNPRFVTRVGYPKSVADYLPTVYKHDYDVKVLLLKMQNKEATALMLRTERGPGYKPTRLEWELAYFLAVKDKFGGNERSLHWNEYPEMAGKETRVLEVRSAMTGVRYAGCRGSTMFDDDHEPPALEDRKVHRIATLDLYRNLFDGTTITMATDRLRTTVDNLEQVQGATS